MALGYEQHIIWAYVVGHPLFEEPAVKCSEVSFWDALEYEAMTDAAVIDVFMEETIKKWKKVGRGVGA